MFALRRFSLLLLAALCCAVAFPAMSWARPSTLVTVGAVSGQLSVQRRGNGAFVALKSRQLLSPGDIVQTGARSKATILFPDGAQVRLNANSRIQITSARSSRGGNTLFRAITGQVWGRLRPGNAVETRTAALGVLGTEIHLDVAEDGATTLTVTDGRVEFFNPFGTVVVEEKQQSTAVEGRAPTRPVTVQNAGLIVEWSFDLNRATIPREKFFSTPDRKRALASLPLLVQNVRNAQNAQDGSVQVLAERAYGEALFDSGQYEAALTQFQTVSQGAPDDTTLRVRIAHTLLELNRLDEAEALLRQTLPANQGAQVQLTATGDGDSATEIASALVALADVQLERNAPRDAVKLAQRALETVEQNGIQKTALETPEARTQDEARLALGVSLLRAGGQTEAGERALREVLRDEPGALEYQARAWLSLALLSRDETANAMMEAKRAVELAPGSGLARGNLALVAFYAGEVETARREANLAIEINPESVAARVALGQALLAQGEVDEARDIAAQAVALDENLPQARTLLGIADASRRDYRHALRELNVAVELAPNDLVARSALARIYSAVGQNSRAVTLLREALPTQRRADTVRAALGEVFYEQGRYGESVGEYQAAIQTNGGSALYRAGLARTLLNSNRLNEAIEAARQAVALAPEIGQYRAILGLALQYARLPEQAEREFRDALLLDPNNALALTQLAYRHSANDLRPAASGFAQGFLLDPGISRQLLRGGVKTEITPLGGTRGARGIDLSHRTVGQDGALQTFGFLNGYRDSGERANDERRALDISENLTWLPDAKTTVYANARARRDRGGLSGSLSSPDTDDSAKFAYNQIGVAARRRTGAKSHLWLGVFGNSSRNDTLNPGLDSFFDPTTGLPIPNQRFISRGLVPEARFDWDLQGASRNENALGNVQSATRVSIGAAYNRTRFQSRRALLEAPGQTGNGVFSQRDSGMLLYGQITRQAGSRLSLSAQLRLQRQNRDQNARITLPSGGAFSGNNSEKRNYLLPNLFASYQINRGTSLRVGLSDRITDVSTSTLAPSELLLTNERDALPFGIANRTRLAQIEVQRRTSARSFVQLFAFRTSASDYQIGYSDLLGFGAGLPAPDAPGLRLDNWRGVGLGARFEGQIGKRLFLTTGATARRTRGTLNGLGTAFSGSDAPYEPKFLGHIGLNYLDEKGNKIGVLVRRVGSFYADTPLALERPVFGGKTYVDLLLAREPGLGAEFYFNVTNVFNSRQIRFNDFPNGQRRVNFGVTRRF